MLFISVGRALCTANRNKEQNTLPHPQSKIGDGVPRLRGTPRMNACIIPVRRMLADTIRRQGTMRELTNLTEHLPEAETCVTIGSFDGLHLGHQFLLRQLVACARSPGRQSIVLTFHPHPRAVLQPESLPTTLSSPEERAQMMAALGVDWLVTLPFTRELAATPAQEFLASLVGALRLRELWVGPGFALGRNREGGLAALQQMAPGLGFAIHIVPPLEIDGAPVSSTRIRTLLAEGDVARAADLLGRPYAFQAEVVHGAARGRTLGFRTANLSVTATRAMPLDGVYAVRAVLGETRWPGVASIGIRPSFDAGERNLEVHLLDFEGDLYGQPLRVEFVQRLRPNRRFDDVQELIVQVQQDMADARRILQAP